LEKRIESMKLLTIVILLVSIVWAEEVHPKMILGAYLKSENAAKSLYEIEKLFQENEKAKALKEKHHLLIGMELLDKYILVTIKPIKIHTVENTLQHLLREKFPDSFIVPHVLESELHIMIKKHKNTSDIKQNQADIPVVITKKKTFLSGIDTEWVALILLALAGLVLVYRSARQLVKIRTLQKELAKYQIILEDEVDNMGVRHG